MAVSWSSELEGALIRILGGCDSVADAITVANTTLGIQLTRKGLNHRFSAMGYGPPSEFLRPAITEPELRRVLFVPDCHHPFVDRSAWELLLETARRWQPHALVILGDFADFYAVSFFAKNPGRKNVLADEIAATRTALGELAGAAGSQCRTRVFLEGNHEERLKRYIAQNAPALHGLVDLPDALGVRQHGFQWVPYKQSYQLGKLRISHDFGKHGAGAILDARNTVEGNAVIGHVHSLGTVYRANIHGDVHVGAAFGWLGDFGAVDYRHADKARRDWAHGFGIGYLEQNGNIHLQAIPIVGRKVVIDGKIIENAHGQQTCAIAV